MKSLFKMLTLSFMLLGLVFGGCQDNTLEEIEQACTSCSPPTPPPPSDDD